MGGSKTTTVTETQQKATPTAEETELNRLLLQRTRATQPGTIQAQQQGLNLINQLLVGQDLPGYLSGLPGGISPDVTDRIVQQSLEDIRPGLQASGLLDSGVRAELEAETAADIRTQAEQFNLQNLMQLLNIAVGGQAQVQQPILSQAGMLGSNLAGLRTITGSGTTSTMTPNPFLSSLGQGLGTGIGYGVGAAVPGGIGGLFST